MRNSIGMRLVLIVVVLVMILVQFHLPQESVSYSMDVTNQSLRISYEIGNTDYWINGTPVERQVQQETPPVIRNGRTFILLRYLAKHLPWVEEIEFEKNIELYPKGRVEITYSNSGKKLYLYVNIPTAEIKENGETTKVQIDPDNKEVVPFIVSGRLHLPLRFLGEQTDAIKILWDEDEKMAELWYLSPFALPANPTEPPRNGYSVSKAQFTSIEHYTEPLDDFCFEEYWKVNIPWYTDTKEVICVSEELKNKIDDMIKDDCYMLYKDIFIYPYYFLVDVEREKTEKTDCCDFDLKVEYEKRDDVDWDGWRIHIIPQIHCNKKVVIHAECTNWKHLKEQGLYIPRRGSLGLGSRVSLGENDCRMPAYNPVAHSTYPPEHRYNQLDYEDAFDIETTTDGRVHVVWVEDRYKYCNETDEMVDIETLNYVFYEGNEWKVVNGDSYPENSPCIIEEEYINAVDLAIDNNGKPHILWTHKEVMKEILDGKYGKYESKVDVVSLSYIKWDDSEWVDNASEVLNDSSSVYILNMHSSGTPIKLMLDKHNIPHLVWLDIEYNSLDYPSFVCFAMGKDGKWLNEKGESTTSDFEMTSIKNIVFEMQLHDSYMPKLRPISAIMDSVDNIHIVYQSDITGECHIYYSIWDGKTWSDSGNSIYYLQGMNPYITLDKRDNPVIIWEDTFITNYKSALTRIFFTRQENGSWVNIEGNDILLDSASVLYQSTYIDIKPKVHVIGDDKYLFTYQIENNGREMIVQRFWDGGWYDDLKFLSSNPDTFPTVRSSYSLSTYAICSDTASGNDSLIAGNISFSSSGLSLYRVSLYNKQYYSLSGEPVKFDFAGYKVNTNAKLIEYPSRHRLECIDGTVEPHVYPIVVEIKVSSDCGVEKELTISIDKPEEGE